MTDKSCSLVICSISIKSPKEEITQLEKDQKSVGILLLGTDLNSQQIKLISSVQPNLVVLDSCYETLDINFIVMNNLYGAYQAGKYLLGLGHKNMGYIESKSRIYTFKMRKKGFLQAISEHNLEIEENGFFAISPTTISSQEEFKNTIDNRKENLPTALFCEVDYMTISVIKSLTELGIKVSEEISIIGFDHIFESQVITPELTTIHVKKTTWS